jgi:RNA polymerase sigma-70 factor (ECF subfamily)
LAVPNTTTNYEQADPDVRLMLQVRDGNAAAFEELVRRYQGRLLTFLENLIGSKESAEDLAQEVFLRVFRARASYEPGARFTTWLFTIATNAASNARRSKGKRMEVGVPQGNLGDTSPLTLDQLAQAASGAMPTRVVDKLEAAGVVRLAMESLGERQRAALLLSQFEGMSYQDIADTMQITIPAVKSLLSRARVNLRDILTPYMQTGQGLDPNAVAAARDE